MYILSFCLFNTVQHTDPMFMIRVCFHQHRSFQIFFLHFDIFVQFHSRHHAFQLLFCKLFIFCQICTSSAAVFHITISASKHSSCQRTDENLLPLYTELPQKICQIYFNILRPFPGIQIIHSVYLPFTYSSFHSCFLLLYFL